MYMYVYVYCSKSWRWFVIQKDGMLCNLIACFLFPQMQQITFKVAQRKTACIEAIIAKQAFEIAHFRHRIKSHCIHSMGLLWKYVNAFLYRL